jgi:hypothetical protein
MRVRWLVVIAALTCAGAARADWTVDKPFRYASVVSKDGKAKLVVACPTVTKGLLIAIYVPWTFEQRRIYVSFRIDSAAIRADNAVVGPERSSLHLVEVQGEELTGADRFRIDIAAPGKRLVYDFDVSRADKAFADLPC